MEYKVRLLTTPDFPALTRMEQSLALDLARHAGLRCALTAEPEAGRRAGAEAYYGGVIRPLAARGLLEEAARASWERGCHRANGAPLDPRVRVFLLAWRERIDALLADGDDRALGAA